MKQWKQSAELAACVLRVTTQIGRQLFSGKNAPSQTPGGLAWLEEFSGLEMTWLLYCAGTATGCPDSFLRRLAYSESLVPRRELSQWGKSPVQDMSGLGPR